jgi:hypothetical protein
MSLAAALFDGCKMQMDEEMARGQDRHFGLNLSR